MQKTYLELATEVTTAMINKGYIRVGVEKGEDWKVHNKKAVKTVGWAILEVYREISGVPRRANEPEKKEEKPKSKLVTAR